MQRSHDSNSNDHTPNGIFDDRADMTQEFWGESRGWAERSESGRIERPPSDSDDTTGAIRAIRDGVTAFRPQRVDRRDPSGEVKRTRVHGASRAPTATPSPKPRSVRREATIGELAGGRAPRRVDHHAHQHATANEPRQQMRLENEHEWSGSEIPLTPVESLGDRLGVGAIDPLLARLGALVLVGVLLVPVALALRPSSTAADGFSTDGSTTAQPVGSADLTTATAGDEPLASVAAGSAEAVAQADGSQPAAQAEPAPAAAVDATTDGATDASAGDSSQSSATESVAAAPDATADTDESVGDVAQSEPAGDATSLDDAATADSEADRLSPECPQTYTAATGDSWYGIADAAGIAPSELLRENSATVDTVIFPGDDICLPSGATVPDPPDTTVAPTTTDAPTTTEPTTTDAPTTTAAPTTTTPAGSPGRNASVDEVKAVIRSIFPESEWDTAYTIADRESRFRPEAYNGWCCHGVFQIYYSVHKSWLDDHGINSADDLYDPLLNTKAAYAIWQRAGNSWTPWSTYDG